MMKRILGALREATRSLGEGLGLRAKVPAEGRYHAFIAYSWDDVSLASAVQRGLERLAKPWYRARALRVFRDATGLPAGPGLRQTLRSALERSDYLILVASRSSAASEHVQREIEHWQDVKGVDRLLIGLAEGGLQWDDAQGDYSRESWAVLPESLRGAFTEEALYVDFTKVDPRELTLDNGEFRDAVRLLAAGPHGLQPAELAGLEVAERRRTVLYARLAGLVLVTLTVVAIIAGVVAIVQRDTAIAQSRVALSRQIAAEAEGVRGARPDLALLLGVQALRTADTVEARSSLLGSLLADPWIARFLYGPSSPVLAMSYVGVGDAELITVHQDGEVIDWNTRRGAGRRIAQLGPIYEALIADTTAAVVRDTGRLDVYRLPSPAARGGTSTLLFSTRPRVRCDPRKLSACQEGLLTTMSEDGSWLITDLEGTHLELWEVEQRRRAARQPPAYLSAPADIPRVEETLVAVRHHFTSPSALASPGTPPDELLSWPLTAGRTRVLKRLQSRHTALQLTGPLVVEDSVAGAATAVDYLGMVTVEPLRSAHPPSITQELSGDEALIDSLLQGLSGVIYLDGDGTVGFTYSPSHTSARMVSGLDTLVERPHGPPVQRRLAMNVESTQLAVAGGLQGVLLLRPPALDPASRPLVGTPLGAPTGEEPERVIPQPPSELPVFSRDGSALAATLNETEGVGLWRTDTGATVAALTSSDLHPTTRVANISIASDDHTVAFVTKPLAAVESTAAQRLPIVRPVPGSVRVWNGRVGDRTRVLALPFTRGDGPTTCVFAAGNPYHLVVGTGLGWLYFWDLRTDTQWRAPLHLPLDTPAPVALLAANASGKLLVGVSGGPTLLVDERTGVATPAPGPRGVIAEAFSPNGNLAAGTDGAGRVRIWVPQTGRAVPGGVLAPSYTGGLTGLTLSDGLLAVISSKAVTLYDTAALREVGQVEIPAGVPEVAFSPTRQALAVGDGTEASVLAIDPKSLIGRACAIANRELTTGEWSQFVGSALPYSATCRVGARR